MRLKNLLILRSLLVLAGFWALPTFAATFTVSSTDDSGAGSLREAIAKATSGDTINFSVTGTIILTTGQLFISQNPLTITGPGASVLTISGNSYSRIFDIGGGVVATISGLTLKNGNGY